MLHKARQRTLTGGDLRLAGVALGTLASHLSDIGLAQKIDQGVHAHGHNALKPEHIAHLRDALGDDLSDDVVATFQAPPSNKAARFLDSRGFAHHARMAGLVLQHIGNCADKRGGLVAGGFTGSPFRTVQSYDVEPLYDPFYGEWQAWMGPDDFFALNLGAYFTVDVYDSANNTYFSLDTCFYLSAITYYLGLVAWFAGPAGPALGVTATLVGTVQLVGCHQ